MPTPDTAGLRDLLERVRAATGADPDLDADIALALGVLTRRDRLEGSGLDPAWAHRDLERNTEGSHSAMVRRVTASIDAAVALVARLLPGWKVGTAGPDPTRPGLALKAWAKVEPWLNNDEGWKVGAHEGFAATVPLAILAALLTAKVSMEESADVN